MNEFDLIDRLKTLSKGSGSDQSLILGIGDDAAIIDPRAIPDNNQLVLATDTLVANRHFMSDDKPEDIAYKALAVNLSDMAAMCAQPKWFLMNLCLPQADSQWLDGFIQGLSELMKRYPVELIGGDTTAGPLTIGFTVIGLSAQPKKRSDAQLNDLIVVSGELGSAAYALHNPGQNQHCDEQLKRPLPRFDVSEAVQAFSRAMIDISDGLLSDLGHICQASGLGARIELDKIPFREAIKNDVSWQEYVLSGGDDYQLCFTIRPEDVTRLPADCTVIGHMQNGSKVTVYQNNHCIQLKNVGFDHFKGKDNE